MSGTSLDGIDVAEVNLMLSTNNRWSFEILQAATIKYDNEWKAILREAIHFSRGRLNQLNVDYTRYLATVIHHFIEKNEIEHLDAVCSHGHTILHQPQNGCTLQIGNLPMLASFIEQTVVCDFRVQDVDMGGQGAPLVPIGDRLLFSAYDYCLNLGGFANCSSEKNGERIAYDICPVNIVLNNLAERLGLPYDDGGQVARAATIDDVLFQQLNELKFYSAAAPKSLGLEWVQQTIFPLLKASEVSIETQIATFTQHVAFQLSQQFEEDSTLLITGGGAYNTYLLELLQQYTRLQITVPDPILLEFKEALIFGLLGVLKLRREINCLASVTGASRDHSSGVLYRY